MQASHNPSAKLNPPTTLFMAVLKKHIFYFLHKMCTLTLPLKCYL